MEEDLKLKSFANGVFSAVFREYNSSFRLPVRLPQSFGSGSCSAAESRSVLRQGSALRAAFTGAFARSFARLRRSPLHFYSYLTSRCLRVCPDGDPFRALVMVCALIAELNLFCCQNSCFAFLTTAPRSLVAIFDRKLRGDFYAGGGWDALGFFCEDFVKTEGELKCLDDILLRLEENSSSDSDASEEEDSDEEEDNPEAENMSADEDSEKEVKGDSSESSDSDESEEVAMDGVANSEDSDDDSDESSDDSDPSSMTEEDSSAESDDSSEEAPCEKPQVNGVATVPQLENQHIKPSDQKDSVT